jgi:hypothetical protein
MVYLNINRERANTLLKELKSFKVCAETTEGATAISEDWLEEFNLKWHKSYLYKIPEEFPYWSFVSEGTALSRMLNEFHLTRQTTIMDGNCMPDSILKGLKHVDKVTAPRIKEDSAGFLHMRQLLCDNIKKYINDEESPPFLNGLTREDLEDDVKSILKAPGKNKHWEYLQSWAAAIFSKSFNCNIMIVEFYDLEKIAEEERKKGTVKDASEIVKRGGRNKKPLFQYAMRSASSQTFDPDIKTIYILFKDNGMHYEALLCKNLLS